ncbi:MAG: MBOAT family O-acyltransferase [Lachnospiraceae bacterium]|nr:MBOAT family O-acyltransferase [Lachnospiraceae bacterium]
MAFNSLNYILLLISVITLYYLLPQRFRWGLLLIASYIFYMAWKPGLIVLILFTTVCNYSFARLIGASSSPRARKTCLLLTLLIDFGLLFVFKYLVFFNNTFLGIFGSHWPVSAFDLILPMGISFYTFQSAAYVIDVYRGEIQPEKHFGIFALFITFFPQLVAGPIERSKNLLPQFYKKHAFSIENLLWGSKLMLWGFFKKIVIADRAAVLVNKVFNHIDEYSGPSIALAALAFTFQIYCDFSGYSDIAQGSARCLGFQLMDNFKTPYLSKSIREFWRRWHISLSGWFSDYIYIPLGGNRKGTAVKCRNLMVTFLVSGLWHGANWTFVLWGALHGIYQIIGTLTLPVRKKIAEALHFENHAFTNLLRSFFTFVLVIFSWILFRANSIADALTAYRHLIHGWRAMLIPQRAYEILLTLGLNSFELVLLGFCLLILVMTEVCSRKKNVYLTLENAPSVLRIVFYALITVLIFTSGVFYDAASFIYFQF